MKKRFGKGTVIIGIIILVILVAAIYLTFIYTPKCSNIACWENKLQSCKRAEYTADKNDVVWAYEIEGKSGGNCKVNVKALEVKQGLTSAISLEGKDMDCFTSLGVISTLESNPNLCHGILKEEMQGIIINKLHQYILQNIGSISQELTGIEGVTQQTAGQNNTNSSL
jgi:hypothetical protein